MDRFIKFYERIDMLKHLRDNVKSEEPETELDSLLTDLSFGIEEGYFERIDHATSALVSFYERYIADANMHTILHEYVNTHRRKNYDDLKLMLMIDVVRAYDSLNHATSLSSPEGIALLMLLIKVFRPDFFLTYDGLKAIPEDIINLDSIVPYISDCSNQLDYPEGGSVIATLLRETHPKAEILYRKCMFRLFESVSAVDGIISLSEKEYLMTLLRLDDDDVNNDIEIESSLIR